MFGEDVFFGSPIVGNVIKVRILVVDDDSTCLSFISGLLKVFNYEVSVARNASEAVSVLCMNRGLFDLVLSNVYMPLMNGAQLQKHVERDFQIPCILMSADNMENLVQEVGLDRNAHVIIKPPAIGELKNLWQYAMSSNSKNKRTGDQGQTSTKRKSTPRDGNEDDEDNDNGENNNPSKKNNKLVWSTKLHNKFLEAIRVIGFKRAVPKKILEYMNVPGLTRENVASHLQKYRIYLKRICDARVSARTGIPENWNQRPFRSNFTWSQFPDLASKSYLLNYATAVRANQNQQPRRASPPSNFGATQLGVNDHTTMRPSFADTKPQCFGAFPSQGLTNSSLNTSYAEKPLPRSSLHQPINKNDVLARVAAKCFTNTSLPIGRLNILESSMVPASNVDYQDSASGDSTSDQSQEMAATPGELSGYSGSDMGRASSNETIVAHPHQGVGINLNDNTGASAGDQIYDENQFVQHYQPTVINMPGFVEQQPPAAVNLSFNFAEHPAPTVYTTAQPSTFLMSGMSNFAQQPPYHYAGVVNLPNYFVPQQAQPVGAGANMMSEFMAQQPHLASAVTNMSGLRHNISTTGYPQVLIPNREMENLSIKCEVEEISDNVNSITAPPMTAGNRLGISASAGSNNVHQQGSQAFYQFGNWAPSTTYDDHSMDHQGEFANGLLSNNDPQIDNKNAN